MTEPVESSKRPPDGSWNPVIMSVVVYPGIGQWMQRRHVSGTGYCAVFTIMAALFVWVLIHYLSEVIPLLRSALDGDPLDGQTLPPLKVVLQPFAIVLFIYFANVVDVLRGRLQARKFLNS